MGDRGLARFVDLGCESDRGLIRLLSRRLAEDDTEAASLGTFVAKFSPESRRTRAGFSRHHADRHWLAQSWSQPVHAKKVA